MAERHLHRADDSMLHEEKKTAPSVAKVITRGEESGYDDFNLSSPPIIELDRKDLLIVKDGTVRVAESLDREQQQLDAKGETVMASGTWTKAEHERFLRAMETFPKGPWKVIAEMVATRTVRQTQTHAQKYREKLARRMRGLRNRNGTLQTPPMKGMVSYPYHIIYPCANVHASDYQCALHTDAVGLAAPTIELARTTSLPAMPLHTSPLTPQSTSLIGDSLPISVGMMTADFSQLNTSTISSAFLDNTTYPSSWETHGTDNKQTVPDFDESMDFLMDVYSTNPYQINSVVPAQSSGMIVTPTACIPRTPQTPMSSAALKRHPGSTFIQASTTIQAKQFARMNNSFSRNEV
ncbi:hypothetical protein PsorP6_002883 [Peronosclerospora sorghi]|uniref:Uncharacterized protein n=1 Tax=Peronosclerospora sorghi TaxID=230839 RepID=A0ACC0VQD3_9STRA|nr:hypothetical protein PsorP6_002883 [Peronosclerospora sorghi]